ncbi:hypothetical protein [Candidatus Bodocaedibacter vickermanii]|uniref:SMODS and SLOG-associating 2TM effector domain-containing protein n=1 Tax=Candidatus Bodocaedibacter vickermanii TaxID=2741701 RepID=A0A7L9RSB7_9PROT|nr:hypothetical protein CPBP_00257 [Candidatus Paracaedibacteraceae bacterium 'Lake Konstanz']
MMLRIMLVLLTVSNMFPAHGATAEPFEDDSASMRTAVDDAGYSDSGEDLAAFPQLQSTRKSRSLHSQHRIIDMEALADAGLAANPARSTAASASSMESFSRVNPTQLFDRDKYLREHVAEMISDEKRYKTASKVCRWCNISWLAAGGMSTVASLVVSAFGTAEYLDPRLSNVLNMVLSVASGGFLWGAIQSKKASHEYHEEMTGIQKALGVPERLTDPEIDLNLEAFKANATGRQSEAPAAAATR